MFVIGAGPQLARIPDDQIAVLESKPTIGVNMTFYRIRPTYFLSAYIGQVILARQVAPSSAALHMRPNYEPALIDGITPLRRSSFDPKVGLSESLAPPEPILFTKRNVALGATHLALILGARQIVYIGVEQRDQLHFWHFDDVLRRTIRQDVEILRDVPFLTIDHPYASYERMIKSMERPLEDLKGTFYTESHEPTSRDYFSCLKSAGVAVITTVGDSVVADAGASYVSLDDVLA